MPESADQPAGAKDRSSLSSPAVSLERADWLSFGCTTLAALVIYLGTLAPEVTLQFSGFVCTSANYAGVAYPPGYPVCTLYSWLFVRLLPFSNIAQRVAVGSAFATAWACGLVALMVSRWGSLFTQSAPVLMALRAEEQRLLRVFCGVVAGLALGLSVPVWQKAVLAETWAVMLLLFTVMLCLFTQWIVRPSRRGLLFGGFLVFGLLLTGNQELVVMIPALLVLTVLGDPAIGRDLSLPVASLAGAGWVLSRLGRFPSFGWLPLVTFVTGGSAAVIIGIQRRQLGSEWKAAGLCLGWFILGLACYFYLPIASMSNPPANWAYPRTLEGFVHAVTRGQYESPHITDHLLPFLKQLGVLAKQSWEEFGWPYLLLMPVPLFLLARGKFPGSKLLVALAAGLLCSGPCMLAWLSPKPGRETEAVMAPYFAAMFVMLAVWIGLALLMVGGVVAARLRSLNHG